MAFSGFSENSVTLDLTPPPQALAIRPTYPSLRYSKQKKGKGKKKKEKKGKKGEGNNQVINCETLLEQSILSLCATNIALTTTLRHMITTLQLPPHEVDILEGVEYHEMSDHYDKD